MRKLLMFVLFVFWSLPAFAQEVLWSRAYGSSHEWEAGLSVQQTTDGGYIVAGETYFFGAGDYDVYLIKTNSLGDTLWNRTFGGSHDEVGGFGQQTTDGGYIVVGSTNTFDIYGAVYLIKTNSLGDTLWTRTYGGNSDDKGYSVQQTTDGGYIVAGGTNSFGAGGYDVYLIKTDSTGDALWARTYGGSSDDYCYSVQQTTDGGYILAGHTRSFGAGGRDVYLIKTNSIGDTLWIRTYGGSSDDYCRSVQQTTDGGYIVGGSTNSFDGPYADVYFIKTDSLGDIVWDRTYGGTRAFSVLQTTDGGYIMAGYISSGNFDVYLIKTDSSGDIVWSRAWGGSHDDFGYSVQQTEDGGYIVAGRTEFLESGNIHNDLMLTKLDSLGNSCIGEFDSCTVMSVSSIVNSPAPVITSPSTVVTSPTTIVTSPATEITTLCMWQRGNANGDGVIDIADVMCLINYLFIEGSPPDPLWLGDANCDGVVDVADVMRLINYLFIEGSPPGC